MYRSTKSATWSSVMPVLPLARIATSACNRHLHLHGQCETSAPVPSRTSKKIWIMDLGHCLVAHLRERFGEEQLMLSTIQPSHPVRISYTVIALRWQWLSLTCFHPACKILSAKHSVSRMRKIQTKEVSLTECIDRYVQRIRGSQPLLEATGAEYNSSYTIAHVRCRNKIR